MSTLESLQFALADRGFHWMGAELSADYLVQCQEQYKGWGVYVSVFKGCVEDVDLVHIKSGGRWAKPQEFGDVAGAIEWAKGVIDEIAK